MISTNPVVADRKVAALRQAMGPVIAQALADRLVVEVMVNPDGKIWIDRIGEGRSFTGERPGAGRRRPHPAASGRPCRRGGDPRPPADQRHPAR